MIYALLIATCLPTVAAADITDATDVRSVSRGVIAAPNNPAAASLVNGSEFSLRHSQASSADENRQWGLYGVFPIGPLSLQLGYEWLHTDLINRRGTIGIGFNTDQSFAIGLNYNYLMHAGESANVFNAAIITAPVSWLSLSFGLEQLNEPQIAHKRLASATWMGLGIRPIKGTPWLTLGAEAYIQLVSDQRIFTTPRLLADFTPTDGVHAQLAYQPDKHEVWLGIGVELANSAVMFRAGRQVEHYGNNIQTTGMLTWRSNPSPNLLPTSHSNVIVQLSGDLKPKAKLFEDEPLISDIILQLYQLAYNDAVIQVTLEIGTLDIKTADVEEIRNAIFALRAAGKYVVAELAFGDEKEYLIAAAADKIRFDPAASLTLNGYSVTLLYFANALDKIGIRFNAVAIGRYKTGPDSLTRAESQQVEKEIIDRILSQLYHQFIASLVNDRHLDFTTIQNIIQQGTITAEQALQFKLVDELSQPTDPSMLPQVRNNGTLLADSLKAAQHLAQHWGQAPVILIIPIVGNITANGIASLFPGDSANAQNIIQQLESARLDSTVKAVVLRIDSPGGEVFAAELIWRAVRLLADTKPVIVSMGSVAASGGYYIATPAHAIIANASTITGSIGIYMIKPDLSGLLALSGINAETRKIGPQADTDSIYKPMADAERASLKTLLAKEYETFIGRVAAGRKLPINQVKKIAEGNVYTGEHALQLGLVDAIGNLSHAVVEACLRAGIDPMSDIEVRIATQNNSFWQLVLAFDKVLKVVPNPFAAILNKLNNISEAPIARMPFEVLVTP
ncbi:MAG: signal peptide peptidase SppA [Deltaproteobacteria bacterium]|nr:signal peptide peptidase SppA [Deltaproteobacteria bacterium]